MTWTVPDQGEPANDLQAVLFQSTLDALAAGHAKTGVFTGGTCTAQGTPDMTVAVAAGTVALAGVLASVSAGNVTIGAADATNPRLDLIVANGSGTKSVVAGTAAASPKEPTLDTTTYVLLAQVYVPAAVTTITTARITDRRVMLVPMILAVQTYNPASLTNFGNVLSTTPADVDATNAVVTFTAPGSGNVIVDIECLMAPATDNKSNHVCLRSGSTTVTGTRTRLSFNGQQSRYSVRFSVTGLTPGTSYTYKLAGFTSSAAGGSLAFYAGDDGTAANCAGPLLMVVRAVA